MFKTENPLVPFIVFFALVILLTIVIANSRNVQQPAHQAAPPAKPKAGLTLSPSKDLPLDIKRKPAQRDGELFDQERLDMKRLLYDAVKEYEEGDVKGAEDKLRTLLVFDPGNIRALSSLGSMLFGQGRFKEAELFYRALAKADSGNASAFNRLASCLAAQKRYEEAIAFVEKAIEIYPDAGDAYVTLSGLYALSGKRQEALDSFKMAYAKLGERILAFSDEPSLDSIKDDPQFKDIIGQAASDMAESAAMSSMKRDVPAPQAAPEPAAE